MNAPPASRAAGARRRRTPRRGPSGRYLCASSRSGRRAGRRSAPSSTLGRRRGTRRPPGRWRTCASMRSASVSIPCRMRKALNGREHAAEVAQALDAQLGDEAVLAEVVPEAQVAVGGDRLGHHREVAVVPGESARVDDRRRRSTCRDRRGTSSPSGSPRRRRSPAGGTGTASPAWRRRRAARPRRARRRPAPRGRRRSRRGWRRSPCRAASCGRAGSRRRRRRVSGATNVVSMPTAAGSTSEQRVRAP